MHFYGSYLFFDYEVLTFRGKLIRNQAAGFKIVLVKLKILLFLLLGTQSPFPVDRANGSCILNFPDKVFF
jgi:hypothetical protein